MFIKAFSPEHFNLGDIAPAEILYFSKKGSLSAQQEKRANMFSELTKDYTPSEGKTAVHTIAMTASEKYGFNRNGDGWKASNLQRDHPSFVSNAKVFRHHRNTPADPSYGVVKASCYNTVMDRVELLMELDNEKCAEELSLLEKHGSYPVSMATRVPYDVCSICENKAKTPREYCWHAKEAMGKILDDGRMVGVDNPHSTFFDISRVVRPADRVAYTLKKASDNAVSGAALAEELGYSLEYLQDLDLSMACSFKSANDKRDTHSKISKMEKIIPAEVRPLMDCEDEKVTDTVKKLAAYSEMYTGSVMRSLADNKILLRPSEFYTLFTGDVLEPKAAAELNKQAYSCFFDFDTDTLINSSLYEPSVIKVSGRISELCASLRGARNIDDLSPMRFDGSHKPTNSSSVKQASVKTAWAKTWCEEYGKYALEALTFIKSATGNDSNFNTMILCGFCQNQLK